MLQIDLKFEQNLFYTSLLHTCITGSVIGVKFCT